MNEAPSKDRDTLEDALACLGWSAMYQFRAWELVSKTAKRLDRQAQVKRNVNRHRAKVRAESGPQNAA